MQRQLLRWFKTHGRSFPWRKRGRSVYQLVLPEILLQRTRAEVVATFLPGFLRRYRSWSSLALATETDLRTYLKPLGLWRRRASVLVLLAHDMKKAREVSEQPA